MKRLLATSVLCGVIVSSLALSAALAEDPPFPAGDSSHELEGLQCSIVMPPDFDAEVERSMIVVLHGAGGTETGMASLLTFLAKDDYVILAPKSKGQVWEKDDLDRVKLIVADLKVRLHIGETRLHGVGFSNGGWNLAPVAFDEDLRFASACWVAAGYKGGKPPKHAKKGMGVIALAGAEDANRSSAEATPGLLEDDVRSAEVRIQPNLGHKWPGELMPYYAWWVGVQEGRFVPGETLAFAWETADADPPSPADDGKSGSLVYWYSEGDAENDLAKILQNETFQNPAVRFFGGQLRAVKRERAENEEAFAAAKLKETPAIVVYDAKGKAKKTLQGKIKARSLASALRSAARTKRLPD
jgi:predicted esterase